MRNFSMRLINLVLIITVPYLHSCDDKHIENNKNVVKGTEVIGSDSLGFVSDFLIVNDKIVLLDDKPINNDNQIRVYDRNNYQFLYSLGRIGSGPGEFRQGMSMNLVHYNKYYFSLLDLSSKQMLFFYENINSQLIYSHNIPLKGGRPYMPISISDTIIYSLCLEIFEGRFAQYDNLGNKVQTLGEIPPGKKEDTPVPVHQQASKGVMRLTPDGSKLIISYQFADMIDIYDLKGNLLNRITGKLGKTPIYETSIRNGYPTMIIDFNKCIYGFLDIEVTNNSIVALYSGKMLNESEYESDQVHIYTFDGKLKDVYKLNTMVSQIALDTEKERLLACSYFPVPKIYSFKLE